MKFDQKNRLCQLSMAGTSQDSLYSWMVLTKLLKTMVFSVTAFSLAIFLKSIKLLWAICSPFLKVTFILSNNSTLYFCSNFWMNCTDLSMEQPVAACTSWFTAIIMKRLYFI